MEQVSDWQPTATAPAETDLELSIYDEGEYHALVFPADATAQAGAMWGRRMSLQPTHWRLRKR
jgi:hypothetical protein